MSFKQNVVYQGSVKVMRSVVSDKSTLVQFFEENVCSEGAEIKQGSKH